VIEEVTTMMEAEFSHLNHATWECKYHVVFTPKWRKKVLFGKIKRLWRFPIKPPALLEVVGLLGISWSL
jgi:hypothetical protein